jgi:hypothetical protein
MANLLYDKATKYTEHFNMKFGPDGVIAGVFNLIGLNVKRSQEDLMK